MASLISIFLPIIRVEKEERRYRRINIRDKLNPNLGRGLLFRKKRKPEKHESSVSGKIENDCSIRARKPNEKARIKI